MDFVRVWRRRADGVFSRRVAPRVAPVSRPNRQALRRFSGSAKLTQRRDFDRVLAEGRRQRTHYFTLLAVDGAVAAPRLGLVIGRRVSPRAVVRNRLKRVAREAFRHARLPPLDIVVLAHHGLGEVNSRDLRSDLDRGFEELTKQCAAS